MPANSRWGLIQRLKS